MKNTEKLAKSIENANKFMHTQTTGDLTASEIYYLVDGIAGDPDAIFTAVNNAYCLAYKRGYDNGKKETAKKRKSVQQ